MKNTVCALVFLSVLLLGCQTDPELPDPELEPPFSPECRLQSKQVQNDYRWHTYEYDDQGRLQRTNEHWNGNLRRWTLLEYDAGRLTRRHYWNQDENQDSTATVVDSLVYNDLGQITEKHRRAATGSANVANIQFYEYDSNGRPERSRYYSVEQDEFWFGVEYFWEGHNLVQVDRYSGDFVEIMQETYYEYHPTALNFERQLGQHPEVPEYRTQNQVSYQRVVDYTGLFDPVCNPCQHEVEANEEHLPVRIKYGWESDPLFLVWDCQ